MKIEKLEQLIKRVAEDKKKRERRNKQLANLLQDIVSRETDPLTASTNHGIVNASALYGRFDHRRYAYVIDRKGQSLQQKQAAFVKVVKRLYIGGLARMIREKYPDNNLSLPDYKRVAKQVLNQQTPRQNRLSDLAIKLAQL